MDLKVLLNSLTLEEKIGQLVMVPPHLFIQDSDTDVFGPLKELGIKKEDIYNAGSILGIGNAEEMMRLQKKYLDNSRHKIPLIFMADIIHGYETIFPVPLALASSFNDEILKKVARISAVEASTAGIQVTFAPMVDLVRDPRWGRVVESFGEDPYLAKRFAANQVQGYQGNDVAKEGNIAACVKHFAAYGLAEAGRDYNTVDLSRPNLFQNYLSGFKGGIDAGAKLVMTSFNIFEGVPATINKYLLKDVLRQHLGFKGVVISDYASLKETITHGVKANEYEGAIAGIEAGLHIEMATSLYFKNLKNAVINGDILESQIDELVLEVLQLKKDCGLFDNPYKGADLKKEEVLVRSNKHLNETLKVAEESIVLLKNKDVLPIGNKTKIALIGRYADTPYLNGPWSWHGSKHRNQTLYEVFKHDFDICYTNDGTSLDFQALNQADMIIIAVGENERDSGEAHSKSNIKLPYDQDKLIKSVKNHTTKPLTVLLFNGRPLDLTDIIDDVDALLECFFPGTMGAQAISNIISGKVNPSAKLTMSFPRSVGQIPIYYNHLNTGRPYHPQGEYTSFYLDIDNTPLFEFGYGLSYSKFKYGSVKLSSSKMKIEDTLRLSVDVTNTSTIEGKEIIQLYIRDHYAEVSRPVKELINFKKVVFKPKETKTIEFDITKEDLKYYDSNLKLRVDTGSFSLMVGANSSDLQSIEFQLIKEVI
jgi:beta-glucosidase